MTRGEKVKHALVAVGIIVLPLGLVAGGVYAGWRFWWRPRHEADETEPGEDAVDPGGSLDPSGLRGDALQIWTEYAAQFSDAVLISAVRDRAAQAQAMAARIARSPNFDPDNPDAGGHDFTPQFIAKTYANARVKAPLQAYVDANVTAQTPVDDIAAGLLAILNAMSDADIVHLSFHFTGDAFDAGPLDDEHGAWLRDRVAKVSGAKFLDTEGGQPAQHVQCPYPPAQAASQDANA